MNVTSNMGKKDTGGLDNGAALFRFFNEIAIIAQLSGTLLESRMPHGLTLSQFSVLNHLVRLDIESTPHEIARAMQVTKGAMTNTIKRLREKGFVDVTPDATDGRSKRVRVTDAGRLAREASIASIIPEILDLAKSVSAPDMIDALPLLEKVRRYLDEAR